MKFRRRALVLGNGARADGYMQARILHGLDAVRPKRGVYMRRRRPAALRGRRMRRARRCKFASPARASALPLPPAVSASVRCGARAVERGARALLCGLCTCAMRVSIACHCVCLCVALRIVCVALRVVYVRCVRGVSTAVDESST